MRRDVSTQISDWSSFGTPPLREQEFAFRMSAASESSIVGQRPINEADALLRTAPGESPERTIAQLQELREAVVDAQEELSAEHQYVINCVHSERLSYAELGRRLGVSKTHAHRLADAAEAALRTEMLNNPIILERLTP